MEAGGNDVIARIIHQIWDSKEIPERYRGYQQSWLTYHPDWEYRLWTHEECHEFVRSFYPDLVNMYEAFPYRIQRIDLARVLFLHRLGGLYVDLDFECMKSLEPLFEGHRVVLGREQGGMGKMLRGEDFVLNALMASSPGHPFWELLLKKTIAANRPKGFFEIKEFYVVRTSGAILLDEAVVDYQRTHDDLKVYPCEMFYPVDHLERSAEARQRKAKELESYAIHHYDGNWVSPGMKLVTKFRYAMSRLRRRSRS